MRKSFRYGFEVREGVPGPESWFAEFESETLSRMTPTAEPSPNIKASGNEGETQILKLEGSGNVQAAANSESWLPMRVHQHGFYETLAEPAAGVVDYELRDRDEVNEVALPFYTDSLHLGVYKGEDSLPSEWQGMGARVSEFEFATDANDFIRFNHSLLFLRETTRRQPTAQVPDATFDGRILVRGHDSQDADYRKFKFVTGGALDGTAEVEWGLGAGAYGATNYPVVAGTWMDVRNPDGSLAGPDGRNLQWYIDDDVLETIALNTEYRIYPETLQPVPVYTARPDFVSTKCTVRLLKSAVTAVTRDIEGGVSLKMMTPRETKFGVGTAFGTRVRRPANSKRAWEFTFDTTYFDRELYDAMMRETPFELYVEARGALIGATGLYDFSSFLLPAMKITEAGASTSGDGDEPESPVFRAFPETSGASLCIETHRTTIADINPLTEEGS